MYTRRNVFTVLWIIGLPVLLSGYQNCAPSGGAGVNAGSGSEVGIVDEFNKASIQFVTPEIDVQSEVFATDLSGFCSRQHTDAQLKWAIWSPQKSEHPVLSGLGNCQGGEFVLKVDQLDQIPCGVQHTVLVEGDWGGSTYARVSRRCLPLASRDVAAPAGSPHGTQCALEYASGAAQDCRRICYRDSKVIFNQALESSQCSDMTADLAGH